MAIGNRRGEIHRMILNETIALGAIGSGLGIVAGVLLAFVISAIGIPMPPMPNATSGYRRRVSGLYRAKSGSVSQSALSGQFWHLFCPPSAQHGSRYRPPSRAIRSGVLNQARAY